SEEPLASDAVGAPAIAGAVVAGSLRAGKVGARGAGMDAVATTGPAAVCLCHQPNASDAATSADDKSNLPARLSRFAPRLSMADTSPVRWSCAPCHGRRFRSLPGPPYAR